MINIRFAIDLIDKIEYSNYEDFETYPSSVLKCYKCNEKISFTFRDLEKHRFSVYTNLTGKDKLLMDRLILALIPHHKTKLEKQIFSLTNLDRFIVWVQRIYLRLVGIKGKFPPIPKLEENVPDSFLDYYCPKCSSPIRVYYFSYLGGRHVENGYIIKFVMS